MRIGTVRPEEARIHDTWQGFHSFHEEETQEPFGSFEVYWEPGLYGEDMDLAPGWYWRACFPGCLPDGDPVGPFATSRQALEAADEWHPEFDE